jgi:hypothetical protein
MSGNRNIATTAAKAGAVALLGAGAIGAFAAPALADGTGNTVHGCYGIYFHTDWNQECGSTGAERTGTYTSYADCELTPDKSVGKRREVGNKTSVDGPDCFRRVRNVQTVFN